MAKEKNDLTVYDATKTVRDKVRPLLEEIKKICAIENIPFFISIAVKNNESGTKYETDGVLTGSYGIKLKDDKFAPMLGVINGGRVIFTDDDDTQLSGEISSMISDEEDENDYEEV